MSTIFTFIRSIASSDILTLACKGFVLELIPHVDSKTLTSWLSVKGASDKTGRSLASVKRYRRELIRSGHLDPSEGWTFKGGSNMNPEQLSGFKYDPRGGSDMTPGGGSDLTPPLYKGNTANKTANHTANESMTGSGLDQIDSRFRPDTKDRTPDNPFDADAFSRQWFKVRGQYWGWRGWSGVVMPYLTPEERQDFLTRLSSVEFPNLGLARAIVNQLISGQRPVKRQRNPSKGTNVPVSLEGDEFLNAIH